MHIYAYIFIITSLESHEDTLRRLNDGINIRSNYYYNHQKKKNQKRIRIEYTFIYYNYFILK